MRRCLTQSKFSNIEIESIRRSYEDFLWYLKRKEIFIVIMIVIMGIVALDVYPPPFRIPVALSYPALPFCSFLHFSCRWYIYTYTCIHDLRIMYTYIYIYICIHQREDTIKKKKKKRRDIHICICTRAFSDKKGLPTVNHAKFFAQFIRVADTK